MSTCPLDAGCAGNCQFCVQKTDCILLALLHRLENLEASIQELSHGRMNDRSARVSAASERL